MNPEVAPIPTSGSLRITSSQERTEFKYLRTTGALIAAPESDAYLRGQWIAKKDGSVRLVVDGRSTELQKRNLQDPKIRFSETSSGAIIKATLTSLDYDQPHFLQLDLKSAYYSIRLSDQQSRYLTIRIEGRVWRFQAPPQGLSSSTGVCVETFSSWWNHLGMTSSFSDNSIFVGTKSDCITKLSTAKTLFESLRIRLNLNQCTISSEIFFLGVWIKKGRYELPRSTIISIRDLLRLEKGGNPLTDAQKKKLDGYRAYLSDLNLISASGAVLKAKNLTHTVIKVDGAKQTAAAAIAQCTGCLRAVEVKRKMMKGSSQAATEQHALLLGLQLAQKHGTETIGSDVLAHQQLMNSNKRDRTMAGLAVDNIVKKRKRIVKIDGGDENPADTFARLEDSKEDVCACGDEPLNISSDTEDEAE